QVDALREVAAGNGSAGFRESSYRSGNVLGGDGRNNQADDDCDERQELGRSLHVVHALVCVALFFLRDHRPLQRSYGTVGAKHRDAAGTVLQVEFLRSSELGPSARFDEVVNDLQACHVLTGGVFTVGSGDESSLAVHNISHQATMAGFAQACTQMLEVNHGGNHSDEAAL